MPELHNHYVSISTVTVRLIYKLCLARVRNRHGTENLSYEFVVAGRDEPQCRKSLR
jgi:hypothetical protein